MLPPKLPAHTTLVLATATGLTFLCGPAVAQCDPGVLSVVSQISSTYKAVLSTDGRYLFVLGNDVSTEALTVHDLSDPAQPVIVRRYNSANTGIGMFTSQSENDLTIVGDTLYLSGTATGIIKADVSDPLNATFSYVPGVGASGTGVDVDGTRLYHSFGIHDVSDPAAPGQLTEWAQGWGWHDVVGAGDYAYATGYAGVYGPSVYASTSGLYSFRVDDLSPGTNLQLNVVPYPTASSTRHSNRLEAYQNAVYAVSPGGTEVFDVSDPANPAIVNSLPPGDAVEIVNDVLFIGSLAQGVRWYDLSDPLAPALIDDVLFPQPVGTPAARGLAIGDEYIYAVGPGWITVIGHCLSSDHPPIAAAGVSFSVDEGQTFVTLDGSGSSDPDGDSLAYSWLQTGGTLVALSDPMAQQPTFTAPLVGLGGETLSFQLTVTANGVAAADTVDVTVDNLNQPPVVAIAAPMDGLVVGAFTLAVSADVTDEDATTITSSPAGLSPGTLAAGGGTVSGSLPLQDEGPNEIIVSVSDAGLLTAATSIVAYRDTAAPSIVISPAEGTVVSTPIPSFAITVTDQTLTDVAIEGDLAGSAEVTGGDVYGVSTALLTGSIPLWNEGVNVIVVEATDAAGNVSSVTRSVILDSTAPVVAIETPLNGACYGTGSEPEIPLSATINDATATEVTGALTGSVAAGGGSLLGTFTLAEGVNQISVHAQDNAGSGLAATDTISVTLDTLAPDVTITAPGDFACVRGTVEFHATASDALPGAVESMTYFVDGVELTPATLYKVDTTALSDGMHELRVDAADSCGNVATTSITIDVDNTAPVVTLSNPLDLEWVSGTIGFDALASDDESGLASITMLAAGAAPSTDGSAVYPTPAATGFVSSMVDTALALGGVDGNLELEVTAVDCAGNETTMAITVQVDNTAPRKAITSPADGSVVRCALKVEADASDPNLASVQFVIDGVAGPVLTAWPFETTFDTRTRLDGDLAITLLATDLLGHVSTCTIHVTVDNLEFELKPERLQLKSRGNNKSVTAKIEGQSADLLAALEPSQITLCVPGGSPVPATLIYGYQCGWRCDHEHESGHRGHRRGHEHGHHGHESKVRVKFDRRLMIRALRGAGLTNGKVEITIKATTGDGTFVLGSDKIRVRS